MEHLHVKRARGGTDVQRGRVRISAIGYHLIKSVDVVERVPYVPPRTPYPRAGAPPGIMQKQFLLSNAGIPPQGFVNDGKKVMGSKTDGANQCGVKDCPRLAR